MNIKELKIETFKQEIQNAIIHKESNIFYSIIPTNIVYAGKGDIDLEYCQNNNYLVYNSVDFGKGLVATKGDIVIVVIKENGWEDYKTIAKVTINYLKSKGVNAEINSNDIIVDDKYKVASYSSVNIGNNYIYTGFQATFNPNIKDIESICKKKCKRLPKGLSEYKINAQDLLAEILDSIKGE